VKAGNALGTGWKQLLIHFWLWLGLCIANLAFALIAIIPFYGWLKSAAGHSLALTRRQGEFDFTFITDLLRNHEGMSVMITQLVIVGCMYFLFSAFLMGGIMQTYVRATRTQSIRTFVDGGMLYFWRMFRVAICFVLMHVVLLMILFFILKSIGINPMTMESDVRFMRILQWILPVYLLAVMKLRMMHLYSKIHIVRNESASVIRSIGAGIRFVRRHFISAAAIYLFCMLLLLLAYLGYLGVRRIVPGGSAGIMIGFLASQVFLFLRVGIKLFVVSSGTALAEIEPSWQARDVAVS
jgi:hypothetical protein